MVPPVLFLLWHVKAPVVIIANIGLQCLQNCFHYTTFQSQIFFFPDDVYRRKRSERDYQQKIADGLIVPNEPAAK